MNPDAVGVALLGRATAHQRCDDVNLVAVGGEMWYQIDDVTPHAAHHVRRILPRHHDNAHRSPPEP